MGKIEDTEVKLLHYTPLEIADIAISKCYDKESYTEYEKQKKRINNVANVSKHSSTIEHLEYNLDIVGISRACLEQLARHRLFSFTVKSTRYTLQELKNEEPFCSYRIIDKEGKDNLEIYGTYEQKERASKYIYLTDVNSTDTKSISALELLRQEIIDGTKRDVAKYCLPECYKTSLTLTGNARVLQNFLSLRTDSHALLEIQKLAHKIYEVLPDEHKFLFEDYVKDIKENKQDKQIKED